MWGDWAGGGWVWGVLGVGRGAGRGLCVLWDGVLGAQVGEVRGVGGVAAGMGFRGAVDRESGGIVVEQLGGGRSIERTRVGAELRCMLGFGRNSSLLSGPPVGIRMSSACCATGPSPGLAAVVEAAVGVQLCDGKTERSGEWAVGCRLFLARLDLRLLMASSERVRLEGDAL